jgi:hypothetical protein
MLLCFRHCPALLEHSRFETPLLVQVKDSQAQSNGTANTRVVIPAVFQPESTKKEPDAGLKTAGMTSDKMNI